MRTRIRAIGVKNHFPQGGFTQHLLDGHAAGGGDFTKQKEALPSLAGTFFRKVRRMDRECPVDPAFSFSPHSLDAPECPIRLQRRYKIAKRTPHGL